MTRPIRLRLILTGAVVTAYLLVLTIQSYAQTVDHAVVQDSRGQPVFTQKSGTCVHIKWTEDNNICHVKDPARHVSSLTQEERTAYFEFNKTYLTPATKVRLDSLAEGLKADSNVKGARIVGFADRIGTPTYNEKLSKKRAENVRDYLVSKGIVNASVADTRWFGASMPATNCPDSLPRSELINCLQKDRRVEVEVDYANDVVAVR